MTESTSGHGRLTEARSFRLGQASPSVLDEEGSSISVVMADVVAKAMKKRPAERFENAARMRAALMHVQVIG